MQGDKTTINFTIALLEGCDCMGESIIDYCNFDVDFTEEEVLTIKKLVATNEHDDNTNLLPILERNSPELHRCIDDNAHKAMKLFWWHVAMCNEEYVYTYDKDVFEKNYQQDIESGDFKPSKGFEPKGNYDEDEDIEYIEWYERELDRMTYEDAQWFHERYNEDFEGVDVSDDEYICYIPIEFLPKT